MPKVLLVEDNEVNRDCIARLLEYRGYEVEVAIDGREGVQKGMDSRYDIVIMDIGLPFMDGYEVTAELRAAGVVTPIVALTAHAMIYDEERAYEVGCNAFETKPIDLKRLLAKLNSLLADRPPRSS